MSEYCKTCGKYLPANQTGVLYADYCSENCIRNFKTRPVNNDRKAMSKETPEIIYRVSFDCTLAKSSTIKQAKVSVDIGVKVGVEFEPDKAELIITGQFVGENWRVLDAKFLSKKLKKQ
jgi:hypothetical protein